MMSPLNAAWVIGRRDFTATVMSRSFFLFLLFPVLMIVIIVGFVMVSGRTAQHENRTRVAVIATASEFAPIAAAHDRLDPAFRPYELAELIREAPGPDGSRQAHDLLGAADKKFSAVLSGGLDHPRLTGSMGKGDALARQVAAILDDARRQAALNEAGHAQAPPALETVKVPQSAGALASARSITAATSQTLLFVMTVMLAGMLLSNLIEEKSNKVIEVLASAIPIDSIFFGKLAAMLSVSLCGIAVWMGAGLAAVTLAPAVGAVLPTPAVGWPIFLVLVFLYFAMNYLLLGALFLGIGSQAGSVREVQTISMPVTIGQVVIYFFATLAVGPYDSPIGISAAIFPFSSPLTMISRAAQLPALWPHLAALAWQALWVWIIVRLGAALFRRNVLKSGGGAGAGFGRRRR